MYTPALCEFLNLYISWGIIPCMTVEKGFGENIYENIRLKENSRETRRAGRRKNLQESRVELKITLGTRKRLHVVGYV